MTENTAKVWQHLVRGAGIDCEYLDDLTTTGTQKTGHTNQYDWGGTNPASRAYLTRLHAHDAEKPKKPIPGLQIDGFFLDDDSSTTRAPQNFYGNKKYPHDSQFVIRFPADWNRKLVVTSAPGLRAQYANDFIIGDFVLEKGYAFASTDKGNSGLRFYSADQTPGEAVLEWHRRINQLTEAAKDAAEKYYGESPCRTYITGNSNAGYVTRHALENHPDTYDGGVDWQGPLWTNPESPNSDPDDKGPNLLTFLPVALKNYPRYVEARDKLREMSKTDPKYAVYKEICQSAYKEITDAGFPGKKEVDSPEKRFFDALWEYHHKNYWNSTQRSFREEFDPYFPGADAHYKYAERIDPKNPFASLIKDAVAKASLSGDIGKPLITVHGTLDTLLPITKSSDKYAELVKSVGKSHLHRYYTIEGGTHIDSLYDYPDPKNPDQTFREKLRPMLPCYKAAFDTLVEWVEDGVSPPNNQTVLKPVGDIVNSRPELKTVPSSPNNPFPPT